jgi:hypothetical protein
MAVTITNPPEQGQLVSVQSRNWLKTIISAGTLPPDHLQINSHLCGTRECAK